MPINNTILSEQDKQWILEQRVTRVSDDQECLIYPMGAENYLSSVLFGNCQGRYDIRRDIMAKNVLVIPGYGNSGFLFAQAGAASVTVYDKDPVTVAWIKAFKKYYHYRQYSAQGRAYPSVGALLTILTQRRPPLVTLPTGYYQHLLMWATAPKVLRRTYLYYLLSLIREAVSANVADDFEWDKNIDFHVGEITQLLAQQPITVFDTAFIPYLLGVQNGIEHEHDIVTFIQQLITLVPKGHLLITPARDTPEFYVVGKRYFETTAYSTIAVIPELAPYIIENDDHWYRTQGLVVLGSTGNLKKG